MTIKTLLTVYLFIQILIIRGENIPDLFFGKLYNLEFNEAKSYLPIHLKTTKDTITNNFLKINYLWWKTLIGQKFR